MLIFTYIQPNRVRNWIFFFSHSQAGTRKIKTTTVTNFVCSRNTLVWIFYCLQENDGTVNCVVRRSKLQTKEHFKRRNSIRLFDKWCVSVFSSFRFTVHSKARTSSTAARSREIQEAAKAYMMQKKTSLKIIIFLNIFRDVVFHSFSFV